MTDTTPPEGNQNHNPDAPTERMHTEHTGEHTNIEHTQAEHTGEHVSAEPTDAGQANAEQVGTERVNTQMSAPEPTTVAQPVAAAHETEPESERADYESTETLAYVPGEPVDYESVSAQDAPTEKVERITTVAEPVHTDNSHADGARSEAAYPASSPASTQSESTHAEAARDEAVAQKKDYTPDYVPAPVIVPTPAAASQTVVQPVAQQPTQQQTQQFAPTPIYVTAPTAPKTQGNRAAGILIGLIATAVFAGLYALVAFFISAAGAANIGDATSRFTDFLLLPVFYVPVIFFFLAFALLVAVLNRAGWWSYVLGGFLVAVVVYFSYLGGALLAVQAWTLTGSEAARFISTQWLNPGAIAAAIVAREVPIWFGAWIARRGRSVTAKNVAARQEYERQLAEGPQLARPV
jgi:hypothetical protein